MATPSIARVKEVFEQWAMYDAVVQADYMRHSELVAALALWARTNGQPLRVVDLGCGDSWLATNAFRECGGRAVSGRRRFRVSGRAGEGTCRDLAGPSRGCRRQSGRVSQGVSDGSANVVLASYSLHHFLSDAKVLLIAECHRILVAGRHIHLDRRGPPRRRTARRLHRSAHAHDGMRLARAQPRSARRACAHVRESDFPETGGWMCGTSSRPASGSAKRFLAMTSLTAGCSIGNNAAWGRQLLSFAPFSVEMPY